MFDGTKNKIPSVRFPPRPEYRILPSNSTLFPVFYRPFPVPYHKNIFTIFPCTEYPKSHRNLFSKDEVSIN